MHVRFGNLTHDGSRAWPSSAARTETATGPFQADPSASIENLRGTYDHAPAIPELVRDLGDRGRPGPGPFIPSPCRGRRRGRGGAGGRVAEGDDARGEDRPD